MTRKVSFIYLNKKRQTFKCMELLTLKTYVDRICYMFRICYVFQDTFSKG